VYIFFGTLFIFSPNTSKLQCFRPQWPRGLKHEMSSNIVIRVIIPHETWMYVRISSVFVLFHIAGGLMMA
jgi:hypothetical protein